MKRIILITLVAILLSFTFAQAENVKAVFKIEWKDGVPVFPAEMEIYGYSAMESVSRNGMVLCQVTAESDVIEALKLTMEFIEYVPTEDIK